MIRGPSGGGKTTLLNLLGTIDVSSSGEISEPIYFMKSEEWVGGMSTIIDLYWKKDYSEYGLYCMNVELLDKIINIDSEDSHIS